MSITTCIRSLTLAALVCGVAAAADAPAKILVFTKSSSFEHSVIKAKPDKTPNLLESTLVELGKKDNFAITYTKDGGVFTADQLKAYDAYLFYTTGDLTQEGTDKNPPMSAQGKQAFLDAIKGGKGFIGLHCASDTFHSASGAHSYTADATVDPYIGMLGAEFIMHGKQQKPKLLTVDQTFPGIAGFKDSVELLEEWYSLKQFAKDLHVLQVLDTSTMEGVMYKRAPYPVTWIHPYGMGKVFYTAMGHRDDVWTSPAYQDLLIGGINYVLGRAKADETPNLDKVAPKALEIPTGK